MLYVGILGQELEYMSCMALNYIQHCMDLQLAVGPYKRCMLFESMVWLPKTHIVSWHISANQISTKHSPTAVQTAVVWYYIQHCMDLQLAVDPYKRRVLFERMDWLLKTYKAIWHISANQISTKYSPTAVVWYEEWGLQFSQKSDIW